MQVKHLFYKKKYLSLKTKLLLIVSVSILLVGFSSLLTLDYIRRERENLNYEALASGLSYSVAKIEDTLSSINTLSHMISLDTALQDCLYRLQDHPTLIEKTIAMTKLKDILQNYAYTSNYISSISITLDDFSISTSNRDFASEWPHLQIQIKKELKSSSNNIIWRPSSLNDGTLLCNRNINVPYALNESPIGLLSIRVDSAKIINDCIAQIPLFEKTEIILVNQSTPIYATKPLFNADLYALLIREKQPYYIQTIENIDYFTVIAKLDAWGWYYICCAPYNYIFGNIKLTELIFFLIIALAILLTLTLSNVLIRTITKDFDLLIEKIKAFRGEKMVLIPMPNYNPPRNDEVALLHQQFDAMAKDLLQLIEDNYTKQLLIKEAHFKALEKQINPHFLYNTLESINWRAKALGDTEISQMVEALGHLLRSSLNQKKDIIPLVEELRFIESYLTIQKIRFEDRLIYEVNLPAHLETFSLPKMSIQPLIENAIKYGVEEMIAPCIITLTIKCYEDFLYIEVKNTGSQFETTSLEDLATNHVSAKGCSIGLMNIDTRIKLSYGNSYGLSLHNEEDAASVQVLLPLTTQNDINRRHIC